MISRGEGNAFEKTRARSARRRILSLDGTHWLIENGHREVSKKAAVRYARFFRVDLDWLLTGKGVGTGVTPPPPQDGTPPPITDATLTEIWSQLSERNRRKLVQIALILSGEG